MSEPAIIVDLKGLAKKLEHRPKAFVVFELLQNVWDEKASYAKVTIRMLPGRPVCEIIVEDDSPEGFAFLESFYMMYRDSKKASDPSLRGRFELGEKLVIALSVYIKLTTTKGTIIIEDGKRNKGREKREAGSIITAHVRMTRAEHEQMMEDLELLVPPEGIETTINGERIEGRVIEAEPEMSLQTVKADQEGVLRNTTRKTKIRLYATKPGETAYIYEMGIPIVELDESIKYHADVQQKVPVNWERNNVPPSYKRALAVAILNAVSDQMTADEVSAGLIQDALGDERTEAEAVRDVVVTQHGDKAVIYDPSDREGSNLAASQGYTVIPGGSYSKDAWGRIKDTGTLLPAGQVTPSPRTYDPDGRPENVIPEKDWTPDMKVMARFCQRLGNKLFQGDSNHGIFIVYVKEPRTEWVANYGRGRLCLNLSRLGKDWASRAFDDPSVLDLMIHEFGHDYESNHLSARYHKALTKLGARMAVLALRQPKFFRRPSPKK